MRYQRQGAKPVTKPLAIIASYQIRVLFWVAVVVLFYLALMPADDVEPIMLVSDKLAHFIAFLGLGIMGTWSYPQRKLWVVLGLIFCGGLIEVFCVHYCFSGYVIIWSKSVVRFCSF
jgi:hypothetical protein